MATETKFTPGPWQNNGLWGITQQSDYKQVIATFDRPAVNLDAREILANAHLIAAAPELYNFIEAKAHHLPIEDQHAASLLLASARGES